MKKLLSLVMAIAISLSMLVSTAYATVTDTLFEQNFDSDVSGITAADFTVIERPVDNSEVYSAYTPDGTKDGALMSDKTKTTKSTVMSGKSFTGAFSLEADFRLEGLAYASSSGQIKFLDAYSSTGVELFMLSSGNCYSGGYQIRPVYKDAAGTVKTVSYKVNGAYLAYKTWHHLKVDIRTDTESAMGSMTFYVNGFRICENARPYSSIDLGKLKDLAKILTYHSSAGEFPYMIDNIKVTEEREASSDTSVSSSVYTVSENEIGVFGGTTVIDLLSNINCFNGATAKVVSESDSEKSVGALSDGDKLRITAENGTIKDYAIVFSMQTPFSYRQSFNDNASGVTLNGFSVVDKNGTSYTPDGTKDGILRSVLGSTNKATVNFDKVYSGESEVSFKFCYEDYDTATTSNGRIKIADIINSSNKSLLLITVGNPTASNYVFRINSTTYQKLYYGVWYTCKILLHESTSSYDVYLDGSLVAAGLSGFNGATPIDAKAINSYSSDATSTKYHYLDEITATQKYSVSTASGAGGSLKKLGAAAPENETVIEGTYSYTAQAEDGFVIDRITVTQGENVTYPTANASGNFDVTINADTEISVTFKENVTSSVTTSSFIKGTRNVEGKTYNTYAVYASVSNPSDVTSYGAIIESADGKSITLPGYGISSMQAVGRFAILVYGDGIKDITCTLMPYITTSNGTINGTRTEEFTD